MYRKKINHKHTRWNSKHYTKCWNQIVSKKQAYQNLVNMLYNVADKKCNVLWEETLPILRDFQNELIELGNVPSTQNSKDVIYYCINLFDITSRYQDLLVNFHIAPENKSEAFSAFNNNLFFAGRHLKSDFRNDPLYGSIPFWNTTDPGEKVTIDNIFFGPDIGLKRKPASYWLTLSKKKKVSVTTTKKYGKGSFKKPAISMWETDAIVKFCVHHFCEVCREAFLDNLKGLLA